MTTSDTAKDIQNALNAWEAQANRSPLLVDGVLGPMTQTVLSRLVAASQVPASQTPAPLPDDSAIGMLGNLIWTIPDDTLIPCFWDGTTMRFKGYMRIDDDGPGSAHNDPDHQSTTSLQQNGQSINSDLVPGGVIPLSLLPLVPGAFIGCQGYATYNGLRVGFVCYDAGPKNRGGEASVKLASLFPGVSTDANTGGINSPDVLWEFLPGQAALVDGIQYSLQPA